MTIHFSRLSFMRGMFLASIGFGSIHLKGQAIPSLPLPARDQSISSEASSEDLVVLDRFVVTAEEDVGSYEATATMAATRIRTELKDVGAAISVITPDFLRDTGARNTQDLLVYTTNTEVGGPRGNFSGLGDGVKLSDEAARLAPQTNTRVRGLSAADNTRDFFLTDVAWDSFNVGRVDIQRGPNAILFGLGSPAGIINASINTASFKDGGKLEYRFGEYGSRRASLDANKVLLSNELAIRLDALDDLTEFEQRPAFNHDRRWFGAVRWDPKFLDRGSAHTSFRANFERGKIDANLPHILPPADFITPWFDLLNKIAVDPAGWIQNPALNSKVNFLNQLGLGAIFATFPNPASGESSLFGNQGFSALAQTRGRTELSAPADSLALRLNLVGTDQLQDPSVFDYIHKLAEGPNKHEWSDHTIYNITGSQTFLNNRLGVELAYDRQTVHRGATGGSDGGGLYIDVNTRLLDGTTNPNFGRPFIETSGTDGSAFNSKREAMRLTAFADVRFTDLMGQSLLARLLGRHVFTGLWDREKSNLEQYNWLGQTADASFVPFFGNDTSVLDRAISTINYLGPSLLDRASAAGANLPNVTALQQVHSGTLRYLDFNTMNWANLDVGVVNNSSAQRIQAENALLRGDTIQSEAVAWQAYLFDDCLVPLVGIRHDSDQNFSLTRAPLRFDKSNDFGSPDYRLPSSPNDTASGNSVSWSVVAHSPRAIRDRLPAGTDVSFFYNHSENFQPNAGRIDPLGTPLPPPNGKTADYGFRLSLLGGRITAKVNWFDTRITNDSIPDLKSFFYISATEAWGYEFAQQTLDGNGNGSLNFTGGYVPTPGQTAAQARADGIAIAKAFLSPQNQPPDAFFSLYNIDRSDTHNPQGISFTGGYNLGVTITGDTEAKGVEYEITAQPVAHWNVSFNASQTNAQSHSLAHSVGSWIESRWATFNLPVSGTSTPAVVGDLRLFGPFPGYTVRDAYLSNVWIPYQLFLAKNNSQVHELRPWRANFVTDYKFTQSWAKGIILGGAYRWQEREILGYPVHIDAGDPNRPIFDLTHPYRGPAETNVDLWIGYERKVFHNLSWRLQLNVNNAFASKAIIPITVQLDGSMAQGRIPEPTLWTLTNSLTF